MKQCLLFFISLILLNFTGEKAYSFSEDFIEINLIENKIGLVDFYFSGTNVNGEFFFFVRKRKK